MRNEWGFRTEVKRGVAAWRARRLSDAHYDGRKMYPSLAQMAGAIFIPCDTLEGLPIFCADVRLMRKDRCDTVLVVARRKKRRLHTRFALTGA